MNHDDCELAKGIWHFNCCNCGRASTNYANGVDICVACLDKLNLCSICGGILENDCEKVDEILNNMAVSTIGLVDGDCEIEYKIWEVFELYGKENLIFKCSLNNERLWEYSKLYDTLIEHPKYIDNISEQLQEKYSMKRILETTFKIVKTKELGDEWIQIEEYVDLHKALINNYKLKVNGISLKQNPNDGQVITLFGMLEDGICRIEYLKEKE